ncbi:MAG: transposase [Verrucomicrobiales bacterium]
MGDALPEPVGPLSTGDYIAPLAGFANGIGRDAEQIVSWCRHHIANGRIGGFNSIISRVIIKARGIRSIDYLFLKLRQESLLQT